MVWELLNGQNPYLDNLNPSMTPIFKITNQDAPRLSKQFPESIQYFISCCLQKKPKHRITSDQLGDISSWLKNPQKPSFLSIRILKFYNTYITNQAIIHLNQDPRRYFKRFILFYFDLEIFYFRKY